MHTMTTNPSPSSHASNPQKRTITLPSYSKIKAINFLDDDSFIILLSLSHAQSRHSVLVRLSLDTMSKPTPLDSALDLGDEDALGEFVLRKFDGKDGFVPVEIVIGEKKTGGGSGNDSGDGSGIVVVVVGEGYRGWRIYDLERGTEKAGFVDESDTDDDDDGYERQHGDDEESMVF